MDIYIDLLRLYNTNPFKFLQLSFICFFHHLFMLNIMYYLYILIHPFYAVAVGMYLELFFTVYLTYKVNESWFLGESDSGMILE